MSTPQHWPSPAHGALDGPWIQGFYFTLRDPVRSKSNFRHGAGTRAQWAQLAGFEEQVFLAARAARPRGWLAGDPTLPVGERPKIIACVYARTMLDVGNVDKSILDAVEGTRKTKTAPPTAGVVMVSDAQVAASLSWGERTNVEQGALVAFARLPHDASSGHVAAAAAALLTSCAALLIPPG